MHMRAVKHTIRGGLCTHHAAWVNHTENRCIQVAYPSVGNPHLRVALGACRFAARPAEGDTWVAGTYSDPTNRRPLRIVEEQAGVTITEAEPSFERIPAVFRGVPRYELQFGN